MIKLLTVSIGGLLGTLAILLFLNSKREQVSSIATPDLAGVTQAESTVKGMKHGTGKLDEEAKRQLAITRLKAFLLAVRRNKPLAH
jgi:hypothetical protein